MACVETVHRRHADVEHHAMRLASLQRLQKLRARHEGDDFVVRRDEEPAKRASHRLFVIDDGDEWDFVWHVEGN